VPALNAMSRLKLPRVALWDVYGGEISSGWMRFVLDQFEFPYELVFANDIDEGGLASKYDVLILPAGAVLSASTDSTRGFQSRIQPDRVPPEWRSRLGRITVAKSLPRIRSFVESGGTLLAFADAAEIGYKLGLPLTDAVVDENDKPLPTAKFYVPGSVLAVAVDTTSAVAWGMPGRVDIFFDNDPAFRIGGEGRQKGLRRVAWFDNAAPLRSGWAWGQKVLDGASEIVTASLGKGAVVLYGPQVHFRGQTHGAFRFLFNGIYSSQVNRQ
ncbi:MAG TPA: peptidase, partial [Gemmatimonadaceae bacterium]|nr:peptidase [Gemmatimonadaceae bacterium]